jgi:MFS family permease
MGTAANVGIFLQATIGKQSPVTPDSWRWVMLIGAGPLLLGLVSLLIVPESPSWLRSQQPGTKKIANRPLAESVFRPPILWLTLIGIVLATTPVIGGWGTANWMMPWAEKVGGPELRSDVMQIRALTGIVGSFLGGWIANWLGRRTTYFVVSVASLAIAQYVFWMLVPTDSSFLTWVALLGFFSGIYFGWLPLCLPELFPTRVRSTGAGLSFNFGRIFTAITLFLSGALMQTFNGDYAAIGRVTSLCFGVGLVAIVLAPRLNPQSLIEEPLETQSQD